VWNQVVINNRDTAYITFDKKLPAYVTGKVSLINNTNGISRIVTKNELTYLTKTRSDVKFDFNLYVDKIKTICTNESREIDLLFLK
jgi:hypothetical protein